MGKSVKKLLCALLVALMCFTSIPFSGFMIANAANNQTYISKSDLESGYVYFGSYPQSKVTDSTTISALNAKAPSWDNWTSYGYYSGTGSDGSMTQGDWMRYTDVTYGGEKYRGVKFTQYRPLYTNYSSSSGNSCQYDNGHDANTVYWFKFESLKWRVLDIDTGLIMCEIIIDSQPYSNTIYNDSSASNLRYAYFNDVSCTNYASDYETSSIRKWLNNDFYNTAFTSADQSTIATSTLNNDGYYTLTGTTGYEKLDSNDTNDKIFLLSYDEAINSNYGFSSDTARQAKGSDYAKCQGLFVSTSSSYLGNSRWLLRSSGANSGYCCGVDSDGYVGSRYYCSAAYTSHGIRPTLKLNLKSMHTHSYTPSVTKVPSHTEEGETTFTCACGDSYTEPIAKTTEHSYVSKSVKATYTTNGSITDTCACGDTYTDIIYATGHIDSNSDSYCDSCGLDLNPQAHCTCDCHKTGITKFFFTIINFFEKLFGNNKVCACGAIH